MQRIIDKWTIRRVQTTYDGKENFALQRFDLVKDETDVIASFGITEIREVQELFKGWEDPYSKK